MKRRHLLSIGIVVVCLAFAVSISITGMGVQNENMGSAEYEGFDISKVIDVLMQSPDYPEMSRYVNCDYSKELVTVEQVIALGEKQPIIYEGIESDVYKFLFVCEGESSGLFIIYDPQRNEVLKTFIVDSAVW